MSENMNISDLEKHLQAAQARLKQVIKSGRGGLGKYKTAFYGGAAAQRALAAAKGEEYAEPYDIGFFPEAAVSGPVLLQTDYVTILTFNAVREMPDGKWHDAGQGIIEVERCTITRFGYPNDEALPGHPLYAKGLGPYGVFEVINSSWVKRLTEQNRVAFPNTPDSTRRHFIITFHDSTFECIARGLKASLGTEPFVEIFAGITRKMFELSHME